MFSPPSGHHGAQLGVLVGCDVVFVPEVARAHARFGSNYLRRVFHMDGAADEAAVTPESLAGRFAAIEAVGKLLDARSYDLSFRDIVVRPSATGRPEVHLSAGAEERFRSLGAQSLDVSISHDGHFAFAVAVAAVRWDQSSSAGAVQGGGV